MGKPDLTLKLKTVCSWCKRVLTEGAPGAEISHTICTECQEAFFPTERAAIVARRAA
jgi:hypothetical protein